MGIIGPDYHGPAEYEWATLKLSWCVFSDIDDLDRDLDRDL